MNLSSKDGVSSPEYEAFVNKFKPKLTTDDCYTPPEVYEAIRGWVFNEYDLGDAPIVRPFYPGGDYEHHDYPDGCVVLDNPPFSILSKICEFYLDRGIRFFLFANGLTCLSGANVVLRMNHIVCDAGIRYENGAVVRTSFVTNLGDPDIVLQTAPELGRVVNEVVEKLKRETVRELPKYEYPSNVITAAMAINYSKYGIDLKVRRSECARISALDSQKKAGKGVFGGALLVSDDMARRHNLAREAAREAARENVSVWELSDREREIIERLNHNGEV